MGAPQLNHSLVLSLPPTEMLKKTKKKSLTFLKKYGTFLKLDLTTNHTRSKLDKKGKRFYKKNKTQQQIFYSQLPINSLPVILSSCVTYG